MGSAGVGDMTDGGKRIFNFDDIKRKRSQQGSPGPSSTLPRLFVDYANPDKVVSELKAILAPSHEVFDRGVLVRVAYGAGPDGAVAHQIDPDAFIVAAHRLCRPYVFDEGVQIDVGLPRPIATMYLSYRDWGVPLLNGIATAPLLGDDGSIRTARGYDAATGLFCEGVPDLSDRIPVNPTKGDAERALASVRRRFRTLPFADAKTVSEGGVMVVDQNKHPGIDESSFHSQLLGAVARPSLWLCPGVSFHGAQISGSGAGKGLAARCILVVAYGRSPYSIAQVTAKDELDKQISSALIDGGPSILLDNFNDMTLASSVLASALTERPSKLRSFGKLKLVTVNALAFVVVTGNGLILSKDIVRRFIRVELDARMEDPEVRDFTSKRLLQDLRRDRLDVLCELLTIWRWGRVNTLKRGVPFGSYEQWGEWVRDPLIALGCQDPVARLNTTKVNDPARQKIANAFNTWWGAFGATAVSAKQVSLTPDIIDDLDLPKRSRQYVATVLVKLAGTRVAGFMLRHVCPDGKWSADTYVLEKTEEHQDWVRTSSSSEN
jgi:hypothetical protein